MQSIKLVVDALARSDAAVRGAAADPTATASTSVTAPPAAATGAVGVGVGESVHGAMQASRPHHAPDAATATATATIPAVGSRWERPYALIGHSMSAGMAMMFAAPRAHEQGMP